MTRPGPPHTTSTDLLVLHALRCTGFAGLGRVAAATGLPESDVESELIDLAVAGLVSHVAGDFGGWGSPRPAGPWTPSGSPASWRRPAPEPWWPRPNDGFLVLNPELLDLCTAWQTRSVGGVVTMNDHSDPGHDARVLDRLTDLDRRAAMTWIHPLAAETEESADVLGGQGARPCRPAATRTARAPRVRHRRRGMPRLPP